MGQTTFRKYCENVVCPRFTLQGVISGEEFDATVKFHLLRPGETWLSDDLEGYEEAVLTVESSDKGFLETYG
ncbi:hypothetical protein PspS49_12860 [Pseudomonas sp. S49]|nr:hypothetical protein PspS49_12860 [Pseudomonas sp. S49]